MRVALVHFSKEGYKVLQLCKAIAKGIDKQGEHSTTLVNGLKEQQNLIIYDYLIFGVSNPSSFSAKIDSDVIKAISNNLGSFSGKSCYAFCYTKGLRKQKTLANWMKCLESNGVILHLSDIIKNEVEAEMIGKKLHIYK